MTIPRTADDAALLALRLVWLALPITAGPLVGRALDDAADGFAATVEIALWAAWAIGLLAVAVPHPASLTAIRLLGPGAAGAAIWAAIVADSTGPAALGVATTAVVAILALTAQIGTVFVDAAAYGDERRLLLRAPAVLMVAPIPLAGVACLAGLAGPLLLLADRRWALGIVAALVGLPVAALAFRSLYTLALRWVVLVPAGLVLHDHLALAEPALFPQRAMARLGPAPAGSAAADLTAGASGLILELALEQPVELARRPPRGGVAQPSLVRAVLFAPTRPGLTLTEAGRRRLPIG